MYKFDMPIGKPVHVLGDPFVYNSNPFGFFYVDVNAPKMNIPILPHRVNTSGGTRTILGCGT
jgi:hypothetical protein